MRVAQIDLIDFAARARDLSEILDELCSPEVRRDLAVELREAAAKLSEQVSDDVDRLCELVRRHIPCE